MSSSEVRRVAIVGLGPKGLFALERLLAHLGTRESSSPVEVHLFHKEGRFGVSPVYAEDQPDYIILNVAVGEVDAWGADEPPSRGGRGPNFVEWYGRRHLEAAPLTGEEFLGRAQVGHYLAEAFERIARDVPPGTRLVPHRGEVVDLAKEESGFRLHWQDQEGVEQTLVCERVLLTTGHSCRRLGPREREWRTFAGRHEFARFIPFVYPVQRVLAEILPKDRVAIKGLGLTCIDAVLQLTEGRGGRFERDRLGILRYRPSGEEPREIFPFSRTGLPMAPKAADLPDYLRPLTFCSRERLERLRRRGKVSLASVRHLLELEMQRCYYEWAMSGEFAERLAAMEADESAQRALVEAFHRARPDVPPFDPAPILDPAGDERFENGRAYHDFVTRYMGVEIERARRGFAGDGLKSAIDIWFEARYAIGEALAYGGLTPEAHQDLLEDLAPRLKRVVFGPPLINLEKLRALADAGLLDFSAARAPRVFADEEAGVFALENECGDVFQAEVLIDGRYPEMKLTEDATPLYRNLLRRGLVRPFTNQNGDGKSYQPGALDHTDGTQRVIDAEGRAHPNLHVIGIPTEGNLLGNFTIVRGEVSDAWARETVARLAP